MLAASDKGVGGVLVANLNRPGANVTGIASLATELTAKQLQLLHELIANAAAFGVVADTFQVSSCPIGSPVGLLFLLETKDLRALSGWVPPLLQ